MKEVLADGKVPLAIAYYLSPYLVVTYFVESLSHLFIYLCTNKRFREASGVLCRDGERLCLRSLSSQSMFSTRIAKKVCVFYVFYTKKQAGKMHLLPKFSILFIFTPSIMIPLWKFGCCNINSIVGKFDTLCGEIEAENFDFYGVVETKIDASTLDGDISIPRYDIFRQDRKKGGGGIAFYSQHGLPCVRFKHHSEFGIKDKSLETLAIRYGNPRHYFIAAVVYIPRSSPKAIDALYEYLCKAFGRNFHCLVIFGDFNANFLSDSPRTPPLIATSVCYQRDSDRNITNEKKSNIIGFGNFRRSILSSFDGSYGPDIRP